MLLPRNLKIFPNNIGRLNGILNLGVTSKNLEGYEILVKLSTSCLLHKILLTPFISFLVCKSDEGPCRSSKLVILCLVLNQSLDLLINLANLLPISYLQLIAPFLEKFNDLTVLVSKAYVGDFYFLILEGVEDVFKFVYLIFDHFFNMTVILMIRKIFLLSQILLVHPVSNAKLHSIIGWRASLSIPEFEVVGSLMLQIVDGAKVDEGHNNC